MSLDRWVELKEELRKRIKQTRNDMNSSTEHTNWYYANESAFYYVLSMMKNIEEDHKNGP